MNLQQSNLHQPRNTDKNIVCLIALIIITFMINVPYFLRTYYPLHDTLAVFHFFSYAYSQLVLAKEVPLWLPFSAFGIPSDPYILFSFGPFQYLSLIIGYFFQVKNTLTLFSLSLIGDSIFLSLGMYLFCRHILQHTWIPLICVVSTLLLIQYDAQIYWNYKILLPMPLALYFAQRGFEEQNLAFVLLSPTILLCWSFGSLPYVLPFQFYVIACYCSCLLLVQFRHLRLKKLTVFSFNILNNLKRPPVILLLIATLLILMMLIYMLNELHGVMTNNMHYIGARDPNYTVSLESFLTYAGNTGYEKLIELLNGLPTCQHFPDFLAFTGMINLILGINSLFLKQKTSSQIALIATTLLVIAFSVVSTGVAKLAYNLPGMNMVRHIGYFIVFGKLLLIITAGFGIRAYLDKNKITLGKWTQAIPIIIAIYTLGITPWFNGNSFNKHAIVFASTVIIYTIISYLCSITNRRYLIGLLIISFLELVTYRVTISRINGLFTTPVSKNVIESKPMHYEAKRINALTLDYFNSRKPVDFDPLTLNFAYKDMHFATYSIVSSYLGKDFCAPPRQDLISPGVKALFNARKDLREQLATFCPPCVFLNPLNDTSLKKTIGCGTAKLRLVSNVTYAKNLDTALTLVAKQDIYSNPVIISDSFGQNAVNAQNELSLYLQSHSSDSISPRYFSANKFSVVVNNASLTPKWLVYADAYNKDWQVMVDGGKKMLAVANLAFKAVQVNPGQHEIEFIYERSTTKFIIFGMIMAACAGAILLLIVNCFIQFGNASANVHIKIKHFFMRRPWAHT